MRADSDESAGHFTVGTAAAIGGLGAVAIDLVQKGDASALFKLTVTVNRYGHMLNASWPDMPVLGVGLLLVIFAVVLAFFSDARSRNAAFFSGASVLSVLMTFVPYDAPLPPPSGTTVNKVSENEGFGRFGGAQIIPAVYRAEARPQIIYAAAGQLPVTVVVHLPVAEGQGTGTPPRIDGRLFDQVSGKQWQIGFADPDPTTQTTAKEVTYRFDFAVETGAPKGDVIADLRLRVTAQGYSMGQSRLSVTTPGMPVTMEITLKPSGVPKALEGIGRIFDRPSF